ncbi:MAG: response regulator transcription factor [Deltaproteobacteria bacterium]|nr:response regulator transcription factor [Deltaproteobacteria bacterium]
MRILLYEKNSMEAERIKNTLENQNIITDIVSDKDEIPSKSRNIAYDLILFGIFYPGQEERGLINDLMENEITTPVLYFPEILSAPDLNEDHSPVQGIFPLLSKLQVVLSASEGSVGSKITFGPVVIDPISHKVWRNNKEISLTPKEYTLLEFFIRHPNQILTRTMIANHVWNQNFDFFTNVIDVYINYLRKKIDFGYEKKLIHTVRGKGYILKEE